MKAPLVSLKKVSKSIEGEEILKDISLDIFRGEFLSVVGASGSGKSSLLYILGLIDSPTDLLVLNSFHRHAMQFTLNAIGHLIDKELRIEKEIPQPARGFHDLNQCMPCQLCAVL